VNKGKLSYIKVGTGKRKHTEELLRESRAHLEVAVQAVNLGLWDWDLRSNKVFFSKEWKRQIGYEENEIPDDFGEWQSRVHPEDVDRVLATINAYLLDPWPDYEIEFRFRHKDGSYRWILARASILYDTLGKPLRMIGCHLDITERKRMEAVMQARLRLLEYAADHSLMELLVKTLDEICTVTESPLGFYTFVDSDQKKITFHAWFSPARETNGMAATEQLHCSLDEAGVWADAIRQRRPVIHNDYVSLSCRQGFPGWPVSVMRELVVPILRGGLVVSAIGVGNKTQEYNERDVEIVSTLAGMAWDIAEVKRAQENIKEYSEKLEAMVAERTRELQEAQGQLVRQERLAVLGQLAGGVGHELRNPLAVMSSALYFLKQVLPEADERARKHISILEAEIRNADKIITDLLDFSRVQFVEREPVSVSDLVDRAIERYPVSAPLVLVVDIPPDLPPVHVDSRQIVQVLGNLLINACQAMPEQGTVTIRSQKRAMDTTEMVGISVIDTGVGILPENMGRLFDPLFTTRPKGIGLGLTVCRKLVEANNGRIEVQSELGKGAAFTLLLPVYTSLK